MSNNIGLSPHTQIKTPTGVCSVKNCAGVIGYSLICDSPIISSISTVDQQFCPKCIILRLKPSSIIMCGQDTKLLLANGQYVPACQLKYGDRLYGGDVDLVLRGFEFYQGELCKVAFKNESLTNIQLANNAVVSVAP